MENATSHGVTPRCPNLASLDVSETRVTGDGLTVFLHTHPNATHVTHSDTVLAFRRLPSGGGGGGGGGSDEKKKSALSKLSCSDCSAIGDDLLEAAVANCDRVEAVSLTNAAPPGIGNESLYRLMTMRNLRELHLGNYDGGGWNQQNTRCGRSLMIRFNFCLFVTLFWPILPGQQVFKGTSKSLNRTG